MALTRKRWTDDEVAAELRAVSVGGYMPSTPDLRAAGRNALACVVTRRGGVRHWAERVGLQLKDSCTKLGQDWEALIAADLASDGIRAERQTTCAPFDILVNGCVRVNVKAARFSEYLTPSGARCSGYFFGIGQTWRHCEVLCLVRVVDEGVALPVLWVPSSEAQQQTITLTSRHRFNKMTSREPLLVRAF